MRLLQDAAERLRQRDMLQTLLVVMAVLLFALAVSWPPRAEPNSSWETVAQARSVALMLAASGLGLFSAGRDQQQRRLETLLAALLFVPLVWPFEAAAYAASYPNSPLWWTVVQPLLDIGSYFGIGLALGLLTRRVAALWPLLPPLLFAGLLGLSLWLQQPLLNPLATAVHLSWTHLALSLCLTALTLGVCVRTRIKVKQAS